MKATKDERIRAEQVSAAVDQLLCDPGATLALPDPGAAEALAAARRMAQLPTLLGPASPALEQRVMHAARQAHSSPRRVPWRRVGWVAAGLIAILVAVMLFTPLGQTAVAGLMGVFNLGRTEVSVAPGYPAATVPATATQGGRPVQQILTLEEAQGLVSFAIPQPGSLPAGFRLDRVNSYTYPDLPAWVPQPFFVELVYTGSEGQELILRIYSIALGDKANISSLDVRSPLIERAKDVDVNGQPGVLLQQEPDGSGEVWQELVWEQGELMLALSSLSLDEQDLLSIARSIPGVTP